MFNFDTALYYFDIFCGIRYRVTSHIMKKGVSVNLQCDQHAQPAREGKIS